MRQFRRPLGYERGFPFTTKGDEGQDSGVVVFVAELFPQAPQLEFVSPPDQSVLRARI